jgi:putative FmdB family regulatory protein
MPIYEYKCLDCGAHVEKMQKFSDAPLTVCENCGGKMEKQLSLSGFQFKGEGWYVTDYSNKNKEKSAEKPETSEKSEKAEKSSAPESTAKTEGASNKTNDSASGSKKEAVSKKD